MKTVCRKPHSVQYNLTICRTVCTNPAGSATHALCDQEPTLGQNRPKTRRCPERVRGPASARCGSADVEALLADVRELPIEDIGALPIKEFLPKRVRSSLATALNALLASPTFEAWRTGGPRTSRRYPRRAMLRGRLLHVAPYDLLNRIAQARLLTRLAQIRAC